MANCSFNVQPNEVAVPANKRQLPLKARIRQMIEAPRVPRELEARFRECNPSELSAVTAALREHYFSRNYFARTPSEYLATREGQSDLDNHLLGRLEADRRRVIPWLDAAKPLRGARILEIGCGTGSSTVALAEQGARVTGVDICAHSLRVAQIRCLAYALNAEFLCLNAVEVYEKLRGDHFDFIIFFATLEHLLQDERLAAIRSTWDMLPAGAMWCVVEAPNRLAAFDSHTSSLPFFSWLPDELAYRYARYSPRATLQCLKPELNQGNLAGFLRHGRGISYHEFELALGPVKNLDVVSCLNLFLLQRNPVSRFLHRFTFEGRSESLFRRVGPKIHRGFYQTWLDLIIRKH